MIVSTGEEMARAIRACAGSESTIQFGSLVLTFHQVAEIDRLEFKACYGWLLCRSKSTWGWYSARELIAAETSREGAPVPAGFGSWEAYLLQNRPVRNGFQRRVDALANVWSRMPKKCWPL